MEALPSPHTRLGNSTQSSPQALPLSSVSLETIKSLYANFVDSKTFAILRSVDSGKIVSYQSKKRGNSPYVLDLDYKLTRHLHKLPSVVFFDADSKLEEYLKLKSAHVQSKFSCSTNMLFLVLSTSSKTIDMVGSWKLGGEINRVVSCVEKLFHCRVVRWHTTETYFKSSNKGWCHYNLILLLDKRVLVYPAFSEKSSNWKWRVGSWTDSRSTKNKIAGFWPYGWVDVQGVASTTAGYSSDRNHPVKNGVLSLPYLLKYTLKAVDSQASRESNPVSFLQFALQKFTNAKAYSFSRSFQSMLLQMSETSHDLINNNASVITKTCLIVPRKKFVFVSSATSWTLKKNIELAKKPPDQLTIYDLIHCLSHGLDPIQINRIHNVRFPPGVREPSPPPPSPRSRHLTHDQACDVFNGVDDHLEIPYE
jgi:hypothetical protein